MKRLLLIICTTFFLSSCFAGEASIKDASYTVTGGVVSHLGNGTIVVVRALPDDKYRSNSVHYSNGTLVETDLALSKKQARMIYQREEDRAKSAFNAAITFLGKHPDESNAFQKWKELTAGEKKKYEVFLKHAEPRGISSLIAHGEKKLIQFDYAIVIDVWSVDKGKILMVHSVTCGAVACSAEIDAIHVNG